MGVDDMVFMPPSDITHHEDYINVRNKGVCSSVGCSQTCRVLDARSGVFVPPSDMIFVPLSDNIASTCVVSLTTGDLNEDAGSHVTTCGDFARTRRKKARTRRTEHQRLPETPSPALVDQSSELRGSKQARRAGCTGEGALPGGGWRHERRGGTNRQRLAHRRPNGRGYPLVRAPDRRGCGLAAPRTGVGAAWRGPDRRPPLTGGVRLAHPYNRVGPLLLGASSPCFPGESSVGPSVPGLLVDGRTAHVHTCTARASSTVLRAFDSVFGEHAHLAFPKPTASCPTSNVDPDAEFHTVRGTYFSPPMNF
ncbi:hypothetical protein Taro_032449 [Colocasia esculenta]|uniref:Uncharacterized protein n=1 Tax=Colocasia esculenta TaxID=4460 RepID=A0A843W3Y7_COLES|nr:hypothetical protein [Colocasia esculenta]